MMPHIYRSYVSGSRYLMHVCGQGPALVCSSCKKEGHLEDDCPDDLLPPIKPLPPVTPRHNEMLEEVLIRVQRE